MQVFSLHFFCLSFCILSNEEYFLVLPKINVMGIKKALVGALAALGMTAGVGTMAATVVATPTPKGIVVESQKYRKQQSPTRRESRVTQPRKAQIKGIRQYSQYRSTTPYKNPKQRI
jgi:Spy/CpxP family protein refolding chaperone